MKNGVLYTDASVNKLIIARMPECSVTQPLMGKSALEIFSTNLFGKAIRNFADCLHIDVSSLEEKFLPLYLDDCLNSSDSSVVVAANDILKLFGERLAVILLCLKEGLPENRLARPDWTDKHWEYWNYLENIILVGGLASPPLGERLLYHVNHVFQDSGKSPYKLILGEDSAYAALRGCASYLKDKSVTGTNLVFDFGQSFIKRSYVQFEKNEVKDMVILDKELSAHAEWDIRDPMAEQTEAAALNEHFLKTIIHTMKEVEADGCIVDSNITLSIANYVKDGVIANRGGYGKLRLIAPNYGQYLTQYLQEKCGREFHFTMIHDGTAMAAGYSNYSRAVCLSMGTAFGVGFPDCQL